MPCVLLPQKASLAETYYGPGPGDGVSGDKPDVAPDPSGGQSEGVRNYSSKQEG